MKKSTIRNIAIGTSVIGVIAGGIAIIRRYKDLSMVTEYYFGSYDNNYENKKDNSEQSVRKYTKLK